MVQRCEHCPGFTALEAFITSKLNDHEIDNDESYSQWENTDGTSTVDFEPFIELHKYYTSP